MRLSPTRRNLGKLAAILGILQGIAWAAMSLAAIILYNWSPDLDLPPNYTKLIEAVLYSHFITGNDTEGINFIITPTAFTMYMWIYFLLSVGWFAVSVDQLTAIYLEKQRQTTIMIIWGVITLFVSLIDLIFVSLLARDYAACGRDATDISGIAVINTNCYLSIGIAMTVAARGYTLWILNLILSIFMFYGAAKFNTAKENDNFRSLFSNHSIPRVTIPRTNQDRSYQGDTKTSFEFSPSSNNHSFSRGEPLPIDFLSGEVSPPSFLSRGEKFSY